MVKRRLHTLYSSWSALQGCRRGAVAVLFAASSITLLTAMGTALNMSQLAAGRAALQRAVDNAALSGAAAYSLNSAAFNSLAISVATTAFCDAVVGLPENGTVVAQGSGQTCGALAGPVVTAVTDSYITGTPGITESAGISCTGAYLPAAPYNCGFIVTVSAIATVKTVIPALFGTTQTIAATGVAANPFISFANIFAIPGGVQGSAKYANSVWAYALKLNAGGGIDYSTNSGGLPDTSSCTGGPDQITCGAYVMLGNGIYAASGAGYTPPGQSVIYDNGVVRNPASPTQITATTPLGVAFRSQGGGNYVQYTPPGVYGYAVINFGAYPPTYSYALNGCIYPYYNLAYHTVTQVWKTTTTIVAGVSTTSYSPMVPWPLVTHWFYSSYLTQNQPPSEGEILGQTIGNEDVPSVIADTAQAGGNILGTPTYNANPLPPVATTCPATITLAGISVPTDTLQTSTYLTSGADNCSLYITRSTSAGYTGPNSSYIGSCFSPSGTPGQAYAALTCQSYGSAYYTFYWNDMGGAAFDDDNYNNGNVQIACRGPSHVVLIQ